MNIFWKNTIPKGPQLLSLTRIPKHEATTVHAGVLQVLYYSPWWVGRITANILLGLPNNSLVPISRVEKDNEKWKIRLAVFQIPDE